jgi:hypothetical protein
VVLEIKFIAGWMDGCFMDRRALPTVCLFCVIDICWKQTFFFEFVGIAAELTGALENSVKGQAVDLKTTLDNCSNIFPDLFSQLPGMEFQPEVTSFHEI